MSTVQQGDNFHDSTLKTWLRLVCCGLCMGTADIIPGISGGTIAFIMGFYEELLNSIRSINVSALNSFFHGRFREFFDKISWKFLLGLVSGIVLAMAFLAHIVTYILNHEHYRVLLYATFFGLIIGATILCALQLKKWRISYFFTLLLTTAVAFFLSGSTPAELLSEDLFDVKLDNVVFSKTLRNFDSTQELLLGVPASTVSAMLAKKIIQPSTLAYSHTQKIFSSVDSFIKASPSHIFDAWIILCGAIAFSAMILPGISGSYLLAILGMYATVIGAMADFSGGIIHASFDIDAFKILLNMLLGIALGALVSTRCVSWFLNHFHDLAIAALTGFMIGALRSVWPFWTYQYALLPLNLEKGPQLEVVSPFLPNMESLETWAAVSLAILGAILIFVLDATVNKKLYVEKAHEQVP